MSTIYLCIVSTYFYYGLNILFIIYTLSNQVKNFTISNMLYPFIPYAIYRRPRYIPVRPSSTTYSSNTFVINNNFF